MSKIPAAARHLDYIEHDYSRLGKFIGLLITIGLDALPIAIALTGPAGLVFGAAFWLVKYKVNKAIEDELMKLGGSIKSDGGPEVAKGSENVFINSLSAARGGPDGDKLNCFTHGESKIAAGSKWVYINNKPAARIELDRTECTHGGTLRSNPASPKPNVFFGGEPTEYDNEYSFHTVVDYANIGKKVTQAAMKKAGEGFAAAMLEAAKEGGEDAADKVADKVVDYLWKDPTFPNQAPNPWRDPAGVR